MYGPAYPCCWAIGAGLTFCVGAATAGRSGFVIAAGGGMAMGACQALRQHRLSWRVYTFLLLIIGGSFQRFEASALGAVLDAGACIVTGGMLVGAPLYMGGWPALGYDAVGGAAARPLQTVKKKIFEGNLSYRLRIKRWHARRRRGLCWWPR